MKKLIMTLAMLVAFIALAQERRTAVLVVQNHSTSRVDPLLIPKLTGVLKTKLAGLGFGVIDPYDSFGVDQNRSAHGEKTPDVSTVDLARKLDADGFVTATVWQLEDSKTSTGVQSENHKYSIRVSINIADAQTRAIECEGVEVNTNSPSYTGIQVAHHGQKYIDDLIYAAVTAAAEGCARKWKNDPAFCEWVRKPHRARPVPPPPGEDRTIFDKIVDELANKMLLDELFWKNYGDLKENLGRKPRVLNGSVKNNSGRLDLAPGLEIASKRFLEKLYGSAKFDVVPDDQIATEIAERLVKSVGTEQDDLIEELKQHGSPDLYVVWELIRSTDLDGTGYYNFILTISHLRRPGGVFWTGQDKPKMTIREVSK